MSRDENDRRRDAGGMADGGDVLAALIRAAGTRPEPTEAARVRVLEAATAAWQTAVRRRRRRRAGLLAAAAGLALAAVLVARLAPETAAPAGPVASVERVAGAALQAPPGEGRSAVTAGTRLPAGTRLETADGGLALRLAGGESLRLAPATTVTLESAHGLRLVAGRVYVDAGPGFDERPLEIRTPAGIARDVGTRFQLGYGDDRLSLSVRDGAVIVHGSGREVLAEAGERVSLSRRGEIVQGAVLPYGPEWEWAQALAMAPELEDQPLTRLLDWVERETGRRIHYAWPGLETKARATVLHGDAARFTPMEALSVMLETTDFRYTVAEDIILIEEAGP